MALAAAHEGVWATVGLHPHDASKGVGTLGPLLRGQPELVAIGECGLDYHYDFSPRPAQREAFAAQVALAHEHGLALVVPHPGGLGGHVLDPGLAGHAGAYRLPLLYGGTGSRPVAPWTWGRGCLSAG